MIRVQNSFGLVGMRWVFAILMSYANMSALGSRLLEKDKSCFGVYEGTEEQLAFQDQSRWDAMSAEYAEDEH